MNKIKDFIYNTSDILVAVIILAISCGIIFWRMEAILDYPEKYVQDNYQKDVVTPVEDDTQEEQQGQEGENQEGDITEPIEPVEEKPLYDDGMLSRDVQVTLSGNTATEAIQCLIDVGIYDDFEDFKASCSRIGRNYNKVTGGVKTFTIGMTKDEITKKVTF